MSDGIEIPAGVVRIVALAIVLALAGAVYTQLPEAKRYLKMRAM
ncbi:MAG: DUF6893 family small protein [Solirubrobacterales bacterium]